MKTLFIDIETTPHNVYRFDKLSRPATTAPGMLIAPSRILCVCWKWYAPEGRGGGHGRASEWVDGQRGMAEKVRAVLDEADVVIHYNGKRFDVPHMNRLIAEQGLTPPSPYRQVDLWSAASRTFNFPSNRMDYVAQWLGVGSKVKHAGFGMWKQIMEGDPDDPETQKARRDMLRYCRQDVDLLEDIYTALLAWAPNLPNAALFFEDAEARCTGCGSTDVFRDGHAYTSAGKFQRYRCKSCGRVSRAQRRTSTTELRGV